MNPKTSTNFSKHYIRLNTRQKEAVETIEGPVMVVAGPGTGKTEILTLRIANILLKTDVGPEAILALTFTEAGVFAMRQRLAGIIGSPAYEVEINTFHGFCNDVISRYPEEFPHIIGAKNITEIEQVKLLEEVIDKSRLKELKPFGDKFYYLRPGLAAIKELKREGLSPEDLSALAKKEEKSLLEIDDLRHEKGPHKGKIKGVYLKLQKQIAKNTELAVLYANYQQALLKNRFYDYDDMIMEVLQALSSNENLLRILQEQYQYMLLDEHQDTNLAQNKVVELLASFHANPNIFAVGDM